MTRLSIVTVIATALLAASSARAGGVVIDMPAPPPAAAAEEGDAPDVGAVALVRYAHGRTSPRGNGSDPGFGAWSWRGPGWGAGWGGAWGFPRYPHYGYGGYRISLGPQIHAWRAWNGGFVRPPWAWTSW